MKKQNTLKKWSTILALFLLSAYFIVTLAFVLPDGNLKDVLKPVNRAASPFFTQSWNVFAPNIAKTNPQIRFQAQWIDDSGERVKTDWNNLTEVEFSAIQGNLLPSRIHKISWNMLSRYQNRYNNLNIKQKKIVKNSFIKREGSGFAAKTEDELFEELSALGSNNAQIRDFLRYDEMMREYVTYFAEAYFPEHEIIRVRWQVFREYPNDFKNRHVEETLKEPSQLSFGWRQAYEFVAQSKLRHFEDVIDRYGVAND